MATKKNPAPSGWHTVTPPRKRGRSASIITEEDAVALMDALEGASNGEYVSSPDTFSTKGRAVAASVRYRRALTNHGLVENMKEVQSRVWQDGDEWLYALRFRPTAE